MNYVSPFQSILSQILALLQIYPYYFQVPSISFSAYLFSLVGHHIERLFINDIIVGMSRKCPNHLKRVSLNLSPIDANPRLKVLISDSNME